MSATLNSGGSVRLLGVAGFSIANAARLLHLHFPRWSTTPNGWGLHNCYCDTCGERERHVEFPRRIKHMKPYEPNAYDCLAKIARSLWSQRNRSIECNRFCNEFYVFQTAFGLAAVRGFLIS